MKILKLILIVLCFSHLTYLSSQTCNNWGYFKGIDPGVQIGDLDIAGNKITIEALFNRDAAYNASFYGGDIVSKHQDPTDVNYLLRPTRGEVTTTTGYHSTPDVCNFKLNKTYYVAMVYDGITLKFYRNGFLMSKTPCTGNLVLNDWLTRIGSTAGVMDMNPSEFHGYINEVRIWNIARTQSELRSYMNKPLPNPSTQNGLLAYYTFNNLKNKQGNTQWDGSILNDASINQTNPTCALIVDSCEIRQTNVTASFTAPDTVCVNTPVTITNTSVNATTYYWSFCQANLNQKPKGKNLGNINSAFSLPVYADIVEQNGNYYGFVTNNNPGTVTRLDYGNSLLNTPSTVLLGNFGGVLENNAEGIQIVNTGNHWYGIVVGGDENNNTSSQIVKLDFGADITNVTPTATDWGNIGNMAYPHKLFIFNNNNNWYGFTANSNGSTITRFNFGTDFTNPPAGTNLGNFGLLNGCTGLNAITDNNKWYVFVTNAVNNTITRLDFGTSLLNTPTANDLGNVGNLMHECFDIYIQKYCDQILGFIVNGDDSYNDIVRLDFKNDLTSIPSAVSLGNIGQLSFPHSFSKLFRVGNDLYTIIPNAHNNTLTRLEFSGCNNSSIPSTTQANPPSIMYDSAGVYNINLSVDDGLPTQTSYCRQVVVVNCDTACNLTAAFTYNYTTCDPKTISFHNQSINADSISWNFGNGQTDTAQNPVVQYANFGTYNVKLYAKTNTGCYDTATETINVSVKKDSIILTNDTAICAGSSVQLNAVNGLNYCWSPGSSLSDSSIQSPVATPDTTTIYYLNSQTLGKNLVVNGSFTDGNTGFSSEYGYQPPQNINEGVYWIGTNPKVWNGGMSPCTDHTSGNGNMMLVNGATQTNKNVWKQTIAVSPNTNYAFSTWIESVYPDNPAQLQFSINGKLIGNVFNAKSTTCIWGQFYSTWNSGNSTTATISIVNMNSIKQGNDFALDDISFSEYIFKQDSVVIKVVQPPVVDAGNNVSICKGSSIQLKATGAATYNWNASPFLSDTTIANPVANPITTTTFIVTGFNSTGCFDTDTVKVTVLALPAITLTNDTTVCTVTLVQLNAQSPGNNIYKWTPATALSNPDISNPVASPTDTIEYFVTVTDSNSCKAIDSVTINVVPKPTISTRADTAICLGTTIALTTTSTNANSFSWLPQTGLNNANIQSPNATPQTTTLYKVLAGNGICSVKDSVSITVLSLPDVDAGRDTTLCGSGTAHLNASGATSYTWSPAATLSNPNIANPLATPNVTTTYFVTGKGSNTCINIDSVTVNVVSAPLFNVEPASAVICNGESVSLTASGGNIYNWLPVQGLSSSTTSTTQAQPQTTTTYTVTITNNLCKQTTSLNTTVTVNAKPDINITKSNDVDCSNQQAQLSASGGVDYGWSPDTNINNTQIPNPVVNPTADTWYSVTVTNVNGCKATDSILVKSSIGSQGFYVPSAFTPNGDGLNDCFGVKFWGSPASFDMQVYDKWGMRVYHSTNIGECWDGSYSGKKQGSGTYVYMIRAKSVCGQDDVFRKGTVVLIR